MKFKPGDKVKYINDRIFPNLASIATVSKVDGGGWIEFEEIKTIVHSTVLMIADTVEISVYEKALKDIMKVCENSRAYTESAHAYFIAKKALEHGKKE